MALAVIAIVIVSDGAGAMTTFDARPLGQCRVVAGEKWLSDAGGASAVCSEIERAMTAAAPDVPYSAEVRALSRSRISATLLINGLELPQQEFAVMDANLGIESIRRFAASLGEAAKAATH